MDAYSGKREVEKPKPVKVQAASCATELIYLRASLVDLVGDHNRAVPTLDRAIKLLRQVAGEKVTKG